MTIKEAWETFKEVDLSHMEYDTDEDYDGEWVYDAVEVDDGTVEDNFPEECAIIDKALKRLEEKEHNCKVFLKQMSGLASRLAKKEKVLEIIKEKVWDIGAVRIAKTLEDYNLKENGFVRLTQEEFDLLKEVFKND